MADTLLTGIADMSLDVEHNITTQEVANFQGETFAPTMTLRDSRQFIKIDDESTSDVRNVLKRPRVLQKWRMDQTTPRFILDWDFFDTHFQIGTRFAGALGFRATTMFRCVFAAPPQVGGRVRAFYNPSFMDLSNKVFTTNRDQKYMEEVGYYTQLPGVECDLSSATAVDLKVPYTSFLDFIPIRSSADDKDQVINLGAVEIRNYLPISIGPGIPQPYCTIYAWLEDLEIIGARNPIVHKHNFTSPFTTKSEPITVIPPGFTGGQIIVSNNNASSGADIRMILTADGSTINYAEGDLWMYPGREGGAVQYTYANGTTYTYPVTRILNQFVDNYFEVEWQEGSFTQLATFGTPPPAQAQSGRLFRFRDRRPSKCPVQASVPSTPTTSPSGVSFVAKCYKNIDIEVNAIVAQSGPMKYTKNTLRGKMEEDTENNGPLSGPLYAASAVSGTVAKYIPMLSSIAQPLSWATRIASNVVSAFGYSRPLQLEHNSRFWHSQNHYQNNADGPDTAFNMGLLQDNKIAVIDNGGGTNVDEMAISYIASKPACIARFSATQNRSGLRYAVSLCPNAFYTVPDVGNDLFYQVPFEWSDPATYVERNVAASQPVAVNGQRIQSTPNFMLGTMFRYFRGGFRFRVKCNKTKFHGGRVALVFTPYSDVAVSDREIYVPTLPDDNNATTDLYGHTKIWDLREESEVVFECPYIYAKPYCEVTEPYGLFSFSFIDNITNGDTVNDTIFFAVEVEAMEDIEYAFPQQKDYIVDPLYDWRRYDQSGQVQPISLEVAAQSGGLKDHGECSFPTDKTDMSGECIGEKILSVKQLLSRAEWTTLYPLWMQQGLINSDKPIKLPHWYEPACYFGREKWNGTNYATTGSYKKSTHDILTWCYLFARGSTNYDVISYNEVGNQNNGVDPKLTQRPEVLITYADESTPSEGLLGTGSLLIEGGPYLHAKAPFYSVTKKIMANPLFDTVRIPDGTDIFPQDAQLTARPRYYGPNNSKLSIRAGDDAQLSFFLCTPPMMYAKDGPFSMTDAPGSTCAGSVDGGQLVPKFERDLPTHP